MSAPSPIAAYQNRLVWSRPDGVGGFELVQRVGDGPIVPARRVAQRAVRRGSRADERWARARRLLALRDRAIGQGLRDPRVPDRARLRHLQARPRARPRVALHDGQREHGERVVADVLEGPRGLRARVRPRPAHAIRLREGDRELASVRAPARRPGRRLRATAGRVHGGAAASAVAAGALRFSARVRLARPRRARGPLRPYEVRVDTIGSGGDHVVVDRSSSGALTALLLGWPAFENGRVFWARQCFVDTSGCVKMRRRLSKGTYTGDLVELGAPSPQFVISHERAAGITWVLRDAIGAADCQGDPPKPAGDCVLEPLRPAYAPLD